MRERETRGGKSKHWEEDVQTETRRLIKQQKNRMNKTSERRKRQRHQKWETSELKCERKKEMPQDGPRQHKGMREGAECVCV